MEIIINGKVSADPRDRVLVIEAVTRSICERSGTDPADGIMMLLTAAVHLQSQYSKGGSLENDIQVLAGCLGAATVAADDFFKLRAAVAPEQEGARE